MVQLRRACDGRRHLSHQPRERYFGHRHAAFVRYLGHAVYYYGVLLRRGVIFEPGVVVLLEALARLAGVLAETSACQGAIWHHGDVVLGAELGHLALLLAEDEVVVVLDGDEFGKALVLGQGVGLGELVGKAVGDAYIPRLARLHHAVEAVHDVVERHAVVPHVVDVEIDVVHAEVVQTGVNHGLNVLLRRDAALYFLVGER